MKTIIAAAGTIALATAAASGQIELTTNGGFENGTTSDWEYFPTPTSTFNVTADADGSMFAAELFNDSPASAAVIKQANIGIGQVTAGQEVTITFSAKGSFAAGGVAFAEFFSELDGGGTSSAEILGGGPLAVTSEWQTFTFTTFAGPDVSGGITLQLTATTGGAPGSTAVVFYDNVSVTIIPTPGAAATLGLAGLFCARRRR